MDKVILKKTMVLFIFLAICCRPVFALDWITIHNQADTLKLDDVIRKPVYPAGSPEDLYLQGLAYLNAYKIQEAKNCFDKIRQIDKGGYVEANWGLAEVLRREHKLDQSEIILESMVKEVPKFVPAYITLAYIKYLKIDFNKAVQLSHRVIEMGPERADRENYLRAHGLYAAAKGMIAYYGGPVSKAINGFAVLKHLNDAQRIDPDSAVVNFGLGAYYMLIPSVLGRDWNKAEQYLLKAIRKDPLFPDPYVRLAQIYKVRKDLAKYEFYLNKALALDPQNELAVDIKSGTCRFICVPYKGQDDK